MIINGKEVSIDDLVETIDINNNIPKTRKNGLVLRDSQIETLKKYNIEYVLTILSFSNHKLKDILIGQQPYDSLEDFVKGKQQKKEFSFFF